jgi:hypothetical protein
MRRGLQSSVRRLLSLRHDGPTEPMQMANQGPDGYSAYSVSPGDPLERRTIAIAAIRGRLAIGGGGQRQLEKGAPHWPGTMT